MKASGKTLVPAVVVVVLAAAGASTVLDSYGVITGTADVQAAVEVSLVYDDGNVSLVKNTDQDIVSRDDMELVNVTGSQDQILASGVEMSSAEKNVTVDLSGVDRIALKIEGTQVDTWEEANQ